jgi:transcription elongation factor Elf1
MNLYILTGMDDAWRRGIYTRFKCPLCGSRKYVQVRVQKPNGNWYVTEFYQCFFLFCAQSMINAYRHIVSTCVRSVASNCVKKPDIPAGYADGLSPSS